MVAVRALEHEVVAGEHDDLRRHVLDEIGELGGPPALRVERARVADRGGDVRGGVRVELAVALVEHAPRADPGHQHAVRAGAVGAGQRQQDRGPCRREAGPAG